MTNRSTMRPACRLVTEVWNDSIKAFLAGASAIPADLREWAESYSGRGRGLVELEAFPEPYLGNLSGQPAAVFLALNPGKADLEFQGRTGIFAGEIQRMGSYAAWAASWPYLRPPWTDPGKHGINRHHASRLRFMRTWVGNPGLGSEAMVAFELYPWHSVAVTARMRPDAMVIDRYVWKPVAELGAPVFAFGAEWFGILKALGLQEVLRVGRGGNDYGGTVASRTVALFKSDAGATVIAAKHSGSATPPRQEEALLLRDALCRWL